MKGAGNGSYPSWGSVGHRAEDPKQAPWLAKRVRKRWSDRGWWSNSFQGQLILYDPEDLALVAGGSMNSWEPQPYAVISVEDYLYHNPAGNDPYTVGSGVQWRFRIGPAAYDRQNQYLYVIEYLADEAKPVVHVWKVSS